jgi:hypothetical protein
MTELCVVLLTFATLFPLYMIIRSRSNKPPKNWWMYHTKDCGTKYRGCSPDCPKDIYERTGEWRGC